MALRGWRLFGVAGTISVYLAGILLLSFMSLNGPPQRNQYYRSAGRYDFDGLRHHEVNMVAKRQPLQWCQPLRYLEGGATTGHQVSEPAVAAAVAPIRRPLQTFAGHYVHSRTAGAAAAAAALQPSAAMADANVDDDGWRRLRRRPATPKTLATARAQTDAGDTSGGRHKSKYSTGDSGLGKLTTTTTTTVKHGGGNVVGGDGDTKRQHQMRPWRTNRKEIKQLSDSTERNLIALASFPGSGNTWLRYLLQQATGIYTGSVYKDFGLLKSGFPAENVFNSSVLVVKTHEWGEKSYVHFAKAILLVRDPDKAIQAEFNRQSGGHVGFAAPDRYKRTKGRYWQQFVTNKLATWEEMNMQWARNYTGDLKIVYYDDLVADVENTLRSVLHFIRYPINEELLACAVQRKEGIYRRKKRIMTFDPFTPEMHMQLEVKKRQVYSGLGRYRF